MSSPRPSLQGQRPSPPLEAALTEGEENPRRRRTEGVGRGCSPFAPRHSCGLFSQLAVPSEHPPCFLGPVKEDRPRVHSAGLPTARRDMGPVPGGHTGPWYIPLLEEDPMRTGQAGLSVPGPHTAVHKVRTFWWALAVEEGKTVVTGT